MGNPWSWPRHDAPPMKCGFWVGYCELCHRLKVIVGDLVLPVVRPAINHLSRYECGHSSYPSSSGVSKPLLASRTHLKLEISSGRVLRDWANVKARVPRGASNAGLRLSLCEIIGTGQLVGGGMARLVRFGINLLMEGRHHEFFSEVAGLWGR